MQQHCWQVTVTCRAACLTFFPISTYCTCAVQVTIISSGAAMANLVETCILNESSFSMSSAEKYLAWVLVSQFVNFVAPFTKKCVCEHEKFHYFSLLSGSEEQRGKQK